MSKTPATTAPSAYVSRKSGETVNTKGNIRALKARKEPHLRYALNPPKIEEFFEKAREIGATVTLVTDDERIEEVQPLKILKESFRVKNGVVKEVKKAKVVRIETVW